MVESGQPDVANTNEQVNSKRVSQYHNNDAPCPLEHPTNRVKNNHYANSSKSLVRFFHAEDGVLKGTDVISSTQNLFAINIKYLHISTMGRFLFERGTMWFLSYRFSYDTIALGPVMRVSVYPSSFLLYHQRFVPQMELRFQQMEIQCPRNYFHQAWLVGWPSGGGEG